MTRMNDTNASGPHRHLNPDSHLAPDRLASDDLNPDLDRRIDDSLAAVPAVPIPEDFALRVLQAMPARRGDSEGRETAAQAAPSAALVPRFGPRATLAALAFLGAVMLAIGLWAGSAGRVTQLVLESVFAGEFALLAVWLALRPGGLRVGSGWPR